LFGNQQRQKNKKMKKEKARLESAFSNMERKGQAELRRRSAYASHTSFGHRLQMLPFTLRPPAVVILKLVFLKVVSRILAYG